MKPYMVRLVTLLFGIPAVLLMSLAAGCSGGEERNVSLALDWFPNSNHAGVYEAVEQGYFEDRGLDVNVYTPSDPSAILQTVGAGQDDFGISYQPDVLQARSEDIPVVSVAAVVQHPLNSIMALGSSGIERPGDLEGMRIGYPGIPLNRGLLATMLAEDGLTLDDVELVDVGFELVPALLGDRVDAIIGAYWTHESILMELEGHEVNIMRAEEWGVPDYYELVLVTNEETLEEREDMVQDFVDAFREGYVRANRNPQESIDVLLEHNPETVDEELERQGVELLQPLWTSDAPEFGWQEGSKWEEFAEWMKSRGLIGEDVDPEAAFTNRFVEGE